MGCLRKFFDVQYCKSRIRNGFTKNGFGVVLKGCIKFFFCTIRIDKGKVNPHSLHSNRKQVISSAINTIGCDDVISVSGNVEDGK